MDKDGNRKPLQAKNQITEETNESGTPAK